MCLDPSKRITVDEALSSQWFSDQAASDALTVGAVVFFGTTVAVVDVSKALAGARVKPVA